MKRTLNVKRTSNGELIKKWGLSVNFKGEIFIRCNQSGVVNWDKAPVYYLRELKERGNYKILD